MKIFKPSQRSSAIFLAMVVCCIMCFSANVSAFNWTDGSLVSYYKMDNSSGNVYDEIKANHGTNVGATRNFPGKIGSAFQLDDNYLTGIADVTGYQDGTIGYWFNTSILTGQQDIYSTHTGGSDSDLGIVSNNIMTSNQGDWYNKSVENITTNEWFYYTFTWNTTGEYLYLNGPEVATSAYGGGWDATGSSAIIGSRAEILDQNFTGTLDEFGIWNRSLTPSEVLELYNSGNGLSYLGAKGVVLTLERPSNGTTISSTDTTFNVSGDVTSSFNATNLTYFIWYDNSTLFNQTTITFSSNQTFNESLLITGLSLDTYFWNAEVCYSNSTFNNCATKAVNRTFNVVPFSVLAESYLTSTSSGSTDNFTINMSVLSGFRMATIKFIYNGTSYDAEFTEYATNTYYASIAQNIPIVSVDTNISFYWTVELESGFQQNSTLHNQTVFNLAFDNCDVYTNKIFNFTIVSETDQSVLNGITDNTSILVDLSLERLDGSSTYINHSQSYSETNPALVCTNVDLSESNFAVDGVIEYSARGRFVEFYHIQNYILTSTTASQNISLYNLNSSLGQEFKITYKDENFNTVPGALIQIQRKYIEDGIFKTVEIPMIGQSGYTIAHLVRNDVIYNLVIIKEGVVVATFDNIVADCQNPSLSSCEININSFSSGIAPQDFTVDDDFTAVLQYNKTSRVVSTIFAIPSGVPAFTSLNVTLFDAFGNTTICSDSLTSAGGTLSCTVPDTFGNASIKIVLTSGGEIRRTAIVVLSTDPSEIYGANLVFLSLTVLLLLIGLGISDNPMMLGIMMVFGTITLISLNLVTNAGWIGNGATILWLIVAVIILFIKGSNRQ